MNHSQNTPNERNITVNHAAKTNPFQISNNTEIHSIIKQLNYVLLDEQNRLVLNEENQGLQKSTHYIQPKLKFNPKKSFKLNKTNQIIPTYNTVESKKVADLFKIVKVTNDSNSSKATSDTEQSESTSIKSIKKRRDISKKGRKHKVKQLSTSPSDIGISCPNESSSSGSSLKNDSNSGSSLRSSSDSMSDDSINLINEIEIELKELIKKSDSKRTVIKNECHLQIIESPRYEQYLIDDSINEDNYILNSFDKADDKVFIDGRFKALKKIKSLPTLNEINDDTEELFEFDDQIDLYPKEQEDTNDKNAKKKALSPIEELPFNEVSISIPIIHIKVHEPVHDNTLTDFQINLVTQFYNDYSIGNCLSTRLIKTIMIQCLKQRKDVKATEDDLNRILYILDADRDGNLNYNEFLELICLFFSKQNNLKSRIRNVLEQLSFKHERKGLLNASEANEFVDFLNIFYGKKFNFMIFHEQISYEQIACQLSEDLAAFTYF